MQLYAYKYGSNYRLTSTPTPTMEGYKFDGWYDDVVGGTKITTRYNFKDDTTIYAHWTPTTVNTPRPTASITSSSRSNTGSCRPTRARTCGRNMSTDTTAAVRV